MNNILNKIVVISLAIHLWFANEELLTKTDADVSNYWWYVVALAYSVIGANAVLTSKKLTPILAFAIMDGLAIHFKINPPINYNLVIGWFYAIYTAYIILITWYMRPKKNTDSSPTQPQEESKIEIQDPPKLEVAKEPTVPTISYIKCMNQVKGMRNGYAPLEQKEQRIRDFISNLPDCQAKTELISKVNMLWNMNI